LEREKGKKEDSTSAQLGTETVLEQEADSLELMEGDKVGNGEEGIKDEVMLDIPEPLSPSRSYEIEATTQQQHRPQQEEEEEDEDDVPLSKRVKSSP